MNAPAKRIVSVLLILLVTVAVFSFATLGNAWGVLMLFLGATIGPAMGLSYPFPIGYKILYISGFVGSIIWIILGIKFSKYLLGQVAVIFGIILWVFLGTIGLGTGT